MAKKKSPVEDIMGSIEGMTVLELAAAPARLNTLSDTQAGRPQAETEGRIENDVEGLSR